MTTSAAVLQEEADVPSSRTLVDAARQQLVEEKTRASLKSIAATGPTVRMRAAGFLYSRFFEFGIGL